MFVYFSLKLEIMKYNLILLQLISVVCNVMTVLCSKGPAMSGTLVNTIGFEWMLFGIAILTFAYAPLMIILRNPPTKEEKKVSLILDK